MADIRLTAESLATVGVSILNKYRVRLRCQTCGRVWMPVPCPEVRLPDGWWFCPKGCNRHLPAAEKPTVSQPPASEPLASQPPTPEAGEGAFSPDRPS